MSRAFVKEDVEVPERSTRRRSASGLPPGALNYLTTRGVEQLRQKIARLQSAGEDEAAAAAERILDSATIIEPPAVAMEVVTLGATVTVLVDDGSEETFRIVGVDEVEFEESAVSWVSPIGRALLGAERGERVPMAGNGRTVAVLKIEHT
ncbi:MAG TPA: GreA/GreB family elongation factor [Chthoniobacteraceae bacterium]|jgi:transcription elongation factor GreB|nr:GreA/GreB family elongation factor [Chthoniobacteraceae bacterium]